MLLCPVAQEEDLQVESPGPHVGVEIRKVRVIADRLVGRGPTELLAQALGERRLACADVACHEDEAFGHVRSWSRAQPRYPSTVPSESA